MARDAAGAAGLTMTEPSKLADLFPPKSLSDWRAAVEKDLKGTPIDSLATTRLDGIVQRPLYGRDDAVDSARLGVPGLRPFTRGGRATGGWLARQEYDDPRADESRSAITEDLARGVEALWLRLGPRWGTRVLTVADLDQLLSGVDLAAVSVCFEARTDAFGVAASCVALARQRDVPLDVLSGGFGLDPLGTLAATGALSGGLESRLRELADLAVWSGGHTPGMRTALISSRPYHEAGATDVQELAWSLATATDYLRCLIGAGCSLDEAAKQCYFSFPISGDFFGQIAKLRAARLLWGKLITAAGGDEAGAAMELHASTSRFNKAASDPWVNILRATAEVSAAVIGGAQSIACAPFDEPAGCPDAFGRRVARNTQTVLREESHLSRVIDPAGGSWFIERLTLDLAREAWSTFQAIEGQGGFSSVLRRGQVANAIDAVCARRRASIADRGTPLVGVNVFANVEEVVLDRPQPTDRDLEEALQESFEALEHETHRERFLSLAESVRNIDAPAGRLFEATIEAVSEGVDIISVGGVLRHGRPDLHIEPARAWRAGDPWQALRDAADSLTTELGHRPVALLANLGPLSSHIARSTWVQNLLAAAGVTTMHDESFDTVDAAVARYKAAKPELVVVCGSEAVYETMLTDAVKAIKAAGCPLVYVAGRPGAREAELRAEGVTDFFFAGADALSLMEALHEALGGPRDQAS